jgi:hypothetical protein
MAIGKEIGEFSVKSTSVSYAEDVAAFRSTARGRQPDTEPSSGR